MTLLSLVDSGALSSPVAKVVGRNSKTMMETPTEKARSVGLWLMRLYFVETLYCMYIDSSLFVMLYRLLLGRGMQQFLIGKGKDDLALRPNSEVLHRTATALLMNCFPILMHLPYSGTPNTREEWGHVLEHTKYLTFTLHVDRTSGLQLFAIDLLLVVVTFLVLSVAIVATGQADEGHVFAVGHPTQPSTPTALDGPSFAQAVRSSHSTTSLRRGGATHAIV